MPAHSQVSIPEESTTDIPGFRAYWAWDNSIPDQRKTHFINTFPLKIQIRWKINFALIPSLAIRLNFCSYIVIIYIKFCNIIYLIMNETKRTLLWNLNCDEKVIIEIALREEALKMLLIILFVSKWNLLKTNSCVTSPWCSFKENPIWHLRLNE